jgi:cephalosporin-C deacetylase-like acetyl esterase
MKPGLGYSNRTMRAAKTNAAFLLRMAVVSTIGFVAVAAHGADDLPSLVRGLDAAVVPPASEPGKLLPRMLRDDARARIQAANERETRAWRGLASREDWERYRNARIDALRASLGSYPAPPADLKTKVSRTLQGAGYRIENLVFESRPGLQVTANLYAPASPAGSMPGILIVHSHHNPKTQGELQDMGVLWARAGCLVLVMDQLGHGERREHPFRDAASYPGEFRPGRQDYYFRYNSAAFLHLAGDSLIGWMAWDIMRGVDLLLARPGVDKARIILLGAVAAGGDAAAVAGALDTRISCVVPFNFGGPEPETEYPLPEDAETSFNYAGSGSWESTRNLRFSARDGFLPWVIVGSVAPRRLLYAHEFAWDQARDPVWKRFEQIFTLYGSRDHLAAVHGRGSVRGQPPQDTHCNNIGAEHRKAGIYEAFDRWFGIRAPVQEPAERRPDEDLLCLAAGARPPRLHELAAALGAERAAAAGKRTAPATLRQRWASLLGGVDPAPFEVVDYGTGRAGDVRVERRALQIGSVAVPFVLLLPAREGKRPAVVAVGQEGKAGFLRDRSREIAELLSGGAAVCLADVRGTGETRPGESVERQSELTSVSATELMLGQTLLGTRIRDLRTVLAYLRSRPDVDASRLALWGDSFAAPNPPDTRFDVPWDAPRLPRFAHPAGALVAVFGALFEPGVRAVWTRGGLASFASVLRSPFLYLPHDAIIPGALAAGDLDPVVAALRPRRVHLEASVDGLNRAAVAAAEAPPAAWLLATLAR